MGVYTFGPIENKRSERWDLKYFAGAVLLQDFDDNVQNCFKDWKIVTNKKPTEKQISYLKKLGIEIPEGISRIDASRLIDEAKNK